MLRLRPCDRYHWPQAYKIFWLFGREKPPLRPDTDPILGLRLWSMVDWGRFRSQPYRLRGRRPKVQRIRRSWASDQTRPWRYYAHVHSTTGMRIWPSRLDRVHRWTAQWRAALAQPSPPQPTSSYP